MFQAVNRTSAHDSTSGMLRYFVDTVEVVNILPLNQTEHPQSLLCNVGKVRAVRHSEGRIVLAFSDAKLPKASHLTASHFVYRC